MLNERRQPWVLDAWRCSLGSRVRNATASRSGSRGPPARWLSAGQATGAGYRWKTHFQPACCFELPGKIQQTPPCSQKDVGVS